MSEHEEIEPLSSSGSKISAHYSAFFVILMVSLVIAALSFAVQQYSLQKDIAEGTEKRLKAEHDHGASSPHDASEQEQRYIEEQRGIAKLLGDSLQKNPKDTSILLSLSSARIAIGDTVGAVQVLGRYVNEVNPANLSAQTDYAYLLFVSGRTEEGEQRMLKVIKNDPKNQIALFNMAAMRYKQNNLIEATTWMERCLAADTASNVGILAKSALAELAKERSQTK